MKKISETMRRKPEYREYCRLTKKKRGDLSQSDMTRIQECKVILGIDGQTDPRPWWQKSKDKAE